MRKARRAPIGKGLPGLAPLRPSKRRTSASRLARELDPTRKPRPKSKSPRTLQSKAGAKPRTNSTPRSATPTPRTTTSSKAREAAARTSATSPRQQRASAAAKTARTREAGIDSRLLGHVSASGRRAQSRRDSR